MTEEFDDEKPVIKRLVGGRPRKDEGIVPEALEQPLNKEGQPPVALQLKRAISKGPYTSTHQKWVAISKLYQINHDRRLIGIGPIEEREFSFWTEIPIEEVKEAPSNREFLEVSRAMAKAGFNLWMQTQLPNLQEAAERLAKTPGKDKEYVALMLSIAELTNFKAADFNSLKAREEKNVEQIIKDVLSTLEPLLDESLTPQKIISRLSAEPDGGDGKSGGGVVPKPAQKD